MTPMKRCSSCGEHKAVEDFHGSRSSKDGRHNQCKVCCKTYRESRREKRTDYSKRYNEKNRERIKAQQKSYREKNKEKIKAKQKAYREKTRGAKRAADKEYYENNSERLRARAKDYYETHREKALQQQKLWQQENRETVRAKQRRWDKKNLAKCRAKLAARRASKIHRTPSWASRENIARIYASCPKGYHVDHVVPLRGRLVSGLHVEGNLQVLPGEENSSKGARYVPRWEVFLPELLRRAAA
jgi:hypothetical protein